MIKEVILENFMSYKYAKIPFSPGINIVTGPNGSGKSSILLGVAVALGQTYTERGRRLSDLIRRGEEIARVTVVFDNRPSEGRRSFPWFRSDDVFFTRYIRSDGEYWHEVNGRPVSKLEVRRYLSSVGLDPDNALIIMHQSMVEEFAFVTPEERLQLLEGAVGLKGYRDRVLSALKMLESIGKEEVEVKEALERAQDALNRWGELYEKHKARKELEGELAELIAELAWTRVRDAVAELNEVENAVKRLEKELQDIEGKINELRIKENEVRELIERGEEDILRGAIELKNGLRKLRGFWIELVELVSSTRVKEFEKRLILAELEGLNVKHRRLAEKVETLRVKALETGKEVPTNRVIEEIEEDIRKVELEIAALGSVPVEVEEVYMKYRESYEDLFKRLEELEANKKRLSDELEKRINIWREKIEAVVSNVDATFRKMLENVGALGGVRLVYEHGVEKASLEIQAGFAGTKPTSFNPLALSGGERTTVIMCFFLALQNHVKSPLRAIDEFDVHMDPRNRDAVLTMIFELASANPNVQYIVITPGLLTKLPQGANVIIAQKVKGKSLVSVAKVPSDAARRETEGAT
ncbi:MAG: AAA family ATPase [Thermofilaceae archaeon]